MSKRVSEAEYRRLQNLPPELQAAAIENAEKAGPSAAERARMMDEAIAEAEGMKTAAATARDAAALDLVSPPEALTIGGRPCRALSVGVLTLLERMGHPLMTGEAMEMEHQAQFLYVMLHPDLPELVRQARAGKIAEAAELWSFDLTLDDLAEMVADLQPMLSAVAGWGSDEGNGERTEAAG